MTDRLFPLLCGMSLVGLAFFALACGPSVPVADSPSPAPSLQPTAIPALDPEPAAGPATPEARPDESRQQFLEVAGGSASPGVEPETREKPASDPAYEPPYKNVASGGSQANRAGASDALSRQSPNQGGAYTYRDGDRELTVLLQNELTVSPDGDIIPLRNTPISAAPGDAVDKIVSASLPVFRSRSGTLMTLPGGVLLVLDGTWGRAETDAFFKRNGIGASRWSELGYVTNGFFVKTKPGFPSLELANTLADRGGVEISSPNWWRERTTK